MVTNRDWNLAFSQSSQRVFSLLVLYRWSSLIPPVIFTLSALSDRSVRPANLLALALATSSNAIITRFSPRLNRMLQTRRWLLLIDLALAALLIGLTGGWRSPYYLYAFSPLMAAAFFFHLRGALAATTLFVPLYLTAVVISMRQAPPDWLTIAINIIGFYLISGAFGSSAVWLDRWRATSHELMEANRSLAAAHQELEVLHSLTVQLHSAADVEEVQEKVLLALTAHMGCQRAVMGLVDAEKNVITGWIGRVQEGSETELKRPPHPAEIPLTAESGLAAQALLDGRPCRATQELCTSADWIRAQFGVEDCLIMPMRWGIQPIGILLVDAPEADEDNTRFGSLEAIAQQTAATLGMMMSRLWRARESAINEERVRMALDIHDTVSQSLFGIVFTLDGLLKLLPARPEAIKPELEMALEAAESVRHEIRRTIHDLWPEEISAPAFEADLRKYASDTLQANQLMVRFDIRGDFSEMSPAVRRSFYRISQEALTNIVHHAAADQACICVDVANGRASLSVRDNGRGFEPDVALLREYGGEHFGLRGIQKRAQSLGGSCDIFSQPDAGTSIIVDVPVNR